MNDAILETYRCQKGDCKNSAWTHHPYCREHLGLDKNWLLEDNNGNLIEAFSTKQELEKEVSVAVGMYYGNIYKIKAFHINNGKKNLLTLKL